MKNPTGLDGNVLLKSHPSCFTTYERDLVPIVGPTAVLDRFRKSHLHEDSIPGLSTPYWVAILTMKKGLFPCRESKPGSSSL